MKAPEKSKNRPIFPLLVETLVGKHSNYGSQSKKIMYVGLITNDLAINLHTYVTYNNYYNMNDEEFTDTK